VQIRPSLIEVLDQRMIDGEHQQLRLFFGSQALSFVVFHKQRGPDEQQAKSNLTDHITCSGTADSAGHIAGLVLEHRPVRRPRQLGISPKNIPVK
jgi:hypothetical protein